MPCTCGSRTCERHNRIQAVADTGLARDGAVFIAFVRHGDEWLPVDATGCPVGDIATRLPATREWKVCDVAAMRAVIAELEDELASVELDCNVYECVMAGTWPGAREMLTAAMAKCPPDPPAAWVALEAAAPHGSIDSKPEKCPPEEREG